MSKYQIYICEDFLNNATRNDDELFWEYGNESLRILSASLTMEISKAGSLELQIPYDHPFVSKIHKKRTRFSVFREGDPIWSGRVLSTKKTFYKTIEIVAEGALTYFLDIIQRPYDYDDIAEFTKKKIGAPSIPTVEWHLKYLIDEYNFRCQTTIGNMDLTPYAKKFNLEIIAMDDEEREELDKRSVNKKFVAEEYSTVSDELSEEIQQRRGGFFLVKYRKKKDIIDGKNPTYKNTLVYCMHEEGLPMDNPQTIEFGKNLLDFEDNEEAVNIYTRCIPLGATYDDVEKLRKQRYEKFKKDHATHAGSGNLPTWEESGFAMPESVDGGTRILRGTTVNLWYLSPWKATIDYFDKDGKPIYDYVQNETSSGEHDDNMYDVERYGVIEQAVEFDNVRLPTIKEYLNSIETEKDAKRYFKEYKNDLDTAAKKWLKKNKLLTSSITVNAIDLADMGVNVDHLDPGYSIPVKSKPHGLNEKGVGLLCSAVNLDLLNPGSSTYTVGAVIQSLTDKSAKNKKQSGKAYGLARDSYSM